MKRPQISNTLGALEQPQRPGKLVSYDFIGPLNQPKRKAKYIFTIIDHLSRLGYATECNEASSKIAIRELKNWISQRGVPSQLLIDCATYFCGTQFESFCRELQIQLFHTAAHNHKSNGMIERYNQSLLGRIRRFLAAEGGA